MLTFDIPLNKASFRVKIWRELKKMHAERQMRSYWSLPYNQANLIDFKQIAREIVRNGGRAEILAGDVIYITKA